MKKFVFGAALLFSCVFAAEVCGQNSVVVGQGARAARQECCVTDSVCAADRFAGLDLSASQQEALKGLSQSKQGGRSDVRDSRREYLDKVKGILTAEQYVRFLENCYLTPVEPVRDRRRMQRVRPHRMQKTTNVLPSRE